MERDVIATTYQKNKSQHFLAQFLYIRAEIQQEFTAWFIFSKQQANLQEIIDMDISWESGKLCEDIIETIWSSVHEERDDDPDYRKK